MRSKQPSVASGPPSDAYFHAGLAFGITLASLPSNA